MAKKATHDDRRDGLRCEDGEKKKKSHLKHKRIAQAYKRGERRVARANARAASILSFVPVLTSRLYLCETRASKKTIIKRK